jgi:hypothetical protein
MTWALLLFAVGMAIIGLISIWRRPRLLPTLGFLALALIIFGVLSLGLSGAWIEVLFRPVIKDLGLQAASSESLWRIALMLSVVCPPGLILAYFISLKTKGAVRVALFTLSFIIYCFICDLGVHALIRAV